MDQRTTGILVIDKPIGISSMKAVAIVRRRAGGVKTGHAGTLDPLASGVLVLGLGKATRQLERLMKTTKRYRTTVDLSAFTATDDLEGDREEVAVDTPPDEAAVRSALAGFVGTIRQRPPAFSAIKIGGRRAYQLARKGGEVEIPEREVTVYDARLRSYEWPMAEIELHTAKGFYVRSFARDLGCALGTGGHCATLRRTAVGPFDESMSVRIDDLPESIDASDVIPLEQALALLPGSDDDRPS